MTLPGNTRDNGHPTPRPKAILSNDSGPFPGSPPPNPVHPEGLTLPVTSPATPIHVVGFGTGLWGLPSASPFVNKLVMWLRMAGLPHTVSQPKALPASKSGKVPYLLRPGGDVLSDSSVIIRTLSAEHAVALDEGLSAHQQAISSLLQRTCEDSLYWSIVYWRWVDDAGWAIVRAAYFGGFPWPLRTLLPPFVRRGLIRNAYAHGLGRHRREEVAAVGKADVDALDALLGDQEFFLGRPSTADAVAWGQLASLARAPLTDPVSAHLRGKPRLLAFVDRMEARWPG